MFISNKEKEAIWNNIYALFEGKRQINNLFKKDRHGTVRPKVDILNDLFADNESNVWNALNELQKRIEKLEKK